MGKNRRTSGIARRAMARARARGEAQPIEPGPAMVSLRVSEVLVDEEWNCRDVLATESGAAADGPGHELTDAELASAIAERGLIHPPRVRQLESGHWALTVGFRRLRALLHNDPEQVVAFTVQPNSGDERADEFRASCDNLSENLNRRNLRPFEIANKLYRMAQSAPEMTTEQLAEAVGLSYPYVSRLLRIRRRAAPELWELFMGHDGANYGAGIGFKDLAVIVRAPKDEQLQRWQKLVAERTAPQSGGPEGRSRKRPGMGQLRKYLRQTEMLGGSEDWEKGVRFGLLVALGRQEWFFASRAQDEQPAPPPTSQSTA